MVKAEEIINLLEYLFNYPYHEVIVQRRIIVHEIAYTVTVLDNVNVLAN